MFSCHPISLALPSAGRSDVAVISDFTLEQQTWVLSPQAHVTHCVPERELDQRQLRARSPVIGLYYFFLVLLKNLNIPDLQSLAFKQPSPGRGRLFSYYLVCRLGLAYAAFLES